MSDTLSNALVTCLQIKVDPLKAIMIIHSEGGAFSGDDIRRELEKKLEALKVTHGIDWSLVDRVAKEQLYDQNLTIAAATPPKEGRNGYIEEVIKAEVEAKPRILEDGKTDYKNIDNIRQVKEGEVVAIRHPAVQGEPGKDIFGTVLPPKPVEEKPFKNGRNTIISEDGFKLTAKQGGFLHFSNGEICVGEVYVVQGDVDFNTGNIHYKGDIQVKGNVAPGFTVEAEGNILVEGTVESGDIVSHEGSISVKQAFFGQGKGRITAKRDITIKYAQDAVLECEGILEIEKGIRNCKVAAGIVKADKSGCSIIGGQVKAYMELALAVLGAESCRTEVVLIDKKAEAASLRLPEIENQKKILQPLVTSLDKKFRELMAQTPKFKGKIPEKFQAEINDTLAQYGRAQKSLAPLDGERKRLTEDFKSMTCQTGKVVITEKIIQGARLSLYGLVRELEAEDARKEWHWTPAELIYKPLASTQPAKPE